MMILYSLLIRVFAEPMDGNIQLAASQSAFDIFTAYAMTLPVEFQQDQLSQPYECWDEMGVENLNISAEWDDLQVTLFETYMEIDGSFARVGGEDIVVFADDDDWFDLCSSFSVDIHSVDIRDLEFSMRLAPSINEQGQLEMAVIGAPIVEGVLDTEIGWFPDELALFFLEDTIWNLIEDQLAEQIPTLINEYADIFYFHGETEAFQYEVGLADTYVRDDAFLLGGNLSLAYLAGGECLGESNGFEGRDIELPFSEISAADIGFGLTEYDLNTQLIGLWNDGLFCLSEEDMAELLTTTGGVIDPEVGGLSATIMLESAPQVVMGRDEISLELQQVNFRLMSQNSTNVVLDLTINISAKLSLTVDSSLSSFALSLHELQLDIIEIQADDILVDDEYSEQYLRQFVSSWIARTLDGQLRDLPIYRAVFHEFGFYVLAKGITHHEGGVEVYLDLYEENDPAIDHTAPETIISLEQIEGETASFSWVGEDNRWDDLAFSYRLDQGTWSLWSLETAVQLQDLLPGEHIFEVKARDKWWNEESIPAKLAFFIDSKAEEKSAMDGYPDPKGCSGCSQYGRIQTSCAWVLGLGLIIVMRRQE